MIVGFVSPNDEVMTFSVLEVQVAVSVKRGQDKLERAPSSAYAGLKPSPHISTQ
jgi:hypothetical protein